jgi:hypothetical protein
MRIDFIDNNTVVASTDKLIDIDLSYYDNVLVSKPVAPEVRFTIAYNHLDNNDPFVNWWKTITQDEIPENVFAVIYDGNGYEVASGDLFEYDEDLQNFALEILIVPGFMQLEIEKSKTVSIQKEIYSSSSIEYISSILYQIFIKAWNNFGIPFSCVLEEPVNGLYPNFRKGAEIIKGLLQREINSEKHFIKIYCKISGSIADYLENLALTNYINLRYSRKDKNFSALTIPQPKQAFGFITGTFYEGVEQIEFTSVFSKIKILNVGGQNVVDLASAYKATMQQRVSQLTVPKKYNIQGNIAFEWLYPGDSISLNGQTYIIKEINYDPVSLNTISHMGSNLNLKFFNAVCVKGS